MYNSNFIRHFKIIRRAIIFLCLFGVLSIGTYFLNTYIFRKYIYSPPSQAEILIVGDSFVASGLDPNIIDNSVNIGMAQEPWVISYYKLKYILEDDTNIKKLLFPYSPLYFSKTYDEVFSDKNISQEMYSRIYPFLNINDYEQFEYNKTVFAEGFLRYKIFPNFQYIGNILSRILPIIGAKYPYIGKYGSAFAPPPLTYDYRAEVEKAFPSGDQKIYGRANLQYLDSIIHFIHKKNIQPIIVGFPVHREFYDVLPSHIVNFSDSVKETLCKEYPFASFLDYTTSFENHSLFRNTTHLNLAGAEKLSGLLNSILNEEGNVSSLKGD